MRNHSHGPLEGLWHRLTWIWISVN
jgi:hypothetical protein